MITFHGNARGGAGGGAIVATGNGFLVKNGSQYLARDVIGTWPIEVRHGDGVGGPLTVRSALPRIIAQGRVDAAITDDQALPVIGAEAFIIRSVIFANASAVPDGAMEGGLYTRFYEEGVAGQVLVPADTGYADLSDPLAYKEVAVDTGELSRAAFLYFRLDSANPDPLSLDVFVLGDVLSAAPA